MPHLYHDERIRKAYEAIFMDLKVYSDEYARLEKELGKFDRLTCIEKARRDTLLDIVETLEIWDDYLYFLDNWEI